MFSYSTPVLHSQLPLIKIVFLVMSHFALKTTFAFYNRTGVTRINTLILSHRCDFNCNFFQVTVYMKSLHTPCSYSFQCFHVFFYDDISKGKAKINN